MKTLTASVPVGESPLWPSRRMLYGMHARRAEVVKASCSQIIQTRTKEP